MAEPSLFPMFMNPLSGGTGAGGDGLIVELMADPDITLDSDISLALDDDSIDIEVDEDIDIEVD